MKEETKQKINSITTNDAIEMLNECETFEDFKEELLETMQKTEEHIEIAQAIWNKCIELKEQHDANG